MTDTATQERTVPRLKTRYHETLRGQLQQELGLRNVMQVPRLEKVVINMGVGAATAQASLLEGAVRDLTTIAGQGGEALLILADPLFTPRAAQLAELTVKHRLPAVSGPREMAEQGLLMTYGPSFAESYRRAASYVDRILKGARPADLPVEQGTKFDLVINAKSARALGVPLPNALVMRADHLVQ